MYQCRTVADLVAAKEQLAGNGRGSRMRFAALVGISPKSLDKYPAGKPERPISGALSRTVELLMMLNPHQLDQLKARLGVR